MGSRLAIIGLALLLSVTVLFIIGFGVSPAQAGQVYSSLLHPIALRVQPLPPITSTAGLTASTTLPAPTVTATPEITFTTPATITQRVTDPTAAQLQISASANPEQIGLWEDAAAVRVVLDSRGLPACAMATLQRQSLQVVLVLDHSISMDGAALLAAQQAASLFVSQMDTSQDHIALVIFNDKASTISDFSADQQHLQSLIEAVVASGGTSIDAGLDRAQHLLERSANQVARPVIVLLSDGQSNPVAANQVAERAKQNGTRIITVRIGLADEQLLRAVASSSSDYYSTADVSELPQIYERIATGIQQSVGRDVQVRATTDALWFYGLDKSPLPTYASVDWPARAVTWQLPNLGQERRFFELTVRGRLPGEHDVLQAVDVQYTNCDGNLVMLTNDPAVPVQTNVEWVPLLLRCLLPLLLFPIVLVAFYRRRNQQPPAQTSTKPPPPEDPAPSTSPPAPPPPALPPIPDPPVVTRRPALVVGLGRSGRWVLTYLQDIREQTPGDQKGLRLLAIDCQRNNDPAIEVLGASWEDGVKPITLAPDKELYLLAGEGGALERNVLSLPAHYPELAAWLGMQQEVPGDDTLRQRRAARFDLLADWPQVRNCLEKQLRDLPTGADVYVVGSLGEIEGAAMFIDVARLLGIVAAQLGKPNLSVHGIVMLPDVHYGVGTIPADIASMAAAAWRELDTAQLVFGQQIPARTVYDAPLLGERLVAPHDRRLLSTCWLISAERRTVSLVGVPPEQGIFPMLADALIARLEEPAATALVEHQSNINNRLSQEQQRQSTALYSSMATFTYQFPAAAIAAEVGDRCVHDLIDSRLLQDNPTANVDLPKVEDIPYQPPHSDKTKERKHSDSEQQRKFRAAQDKLWREHLRTVDTLLLLGTGLGWLVFTVGMLSQGWLIAGIGLLVILASVGIGGWMLAFKKPIDSSDEELVENAHMGGVLDKLKEDIAQRLQDAQQRLCDEVCNNLNNGAGLPSATRFVAGVREQWQREVDLLKPQLAACQRQISEQLNAAAMSGPRWSPRDGLRWLFGATTSTAHERLLAQAQQRIDLEIEREKIKARIELFEQLVTDSTDLEEQLQSQRAMLDEERTQIEQRLELARQRRSQQLLLWRVRHEWGQPYEALAQYSDFFQPAISVPLPQQEERRRVVQQLQAYLKGEHIAELLAPYQEGCVAKYKRLMWNYGKRDGQLRLQPCMYLDTVQPLTSDADAFKHLRQHLSAWVLGKSLSGLLCEAFNHPASLTQPAGSEQLAEQFNQRGSFAVRYVPLGADPHEAYTFVLLPPLDDAGRVFFQQVEATQRRQGGPATSYHYLPGTAPTRAVLLYTGELIGALYAGPATTQSYLPMYNELMQYYQLCGNQRLLLHQDVPHSLAAMIEQDTVFGNRRRLSPHLVACLGNLERINSFIQLLLREWVKEEPVDRERCLTTTIPGVGSVRLAQVAAEHGSPWVAGLRRWCLGEDDALAEATRRVAKFMQEQPLTSQQCYDALDAPNGYCQTLQRSAHPLEQELGLVVQVLVERQFVGE